MTTLLISPSHRLKAAFIPYSSIFKFYAAQIDLILGSALSNGIKLNLNLVQREIRAGIIFEI